MIFSRAVIPAGPVTRIRGMAKKTAPHRLGQVLDQYLSRADIRAKILEQKVLNAWEQAVGKGIAEVTQAVRVRNRVLQVQVIHSVWVQELQFHKASIIKRINTLLGTPAIQELWFFVGEKKTAPRSADAGEARWSPRGKELSREEEARIEEEVSQVRDPEVKRALSRLYTRALSWEKIRRGG